MTPPKVALTYREHLRHLIQLAAARDLVQAIEVVPSGYAFLGLAPLLAKRLQDLGLPYAFHFVEGSVGSADFFENNHTAMLREFLVGFEPMHVSDHLTAARAGDLDLEMNLPIVADEESVEIYVENVVFMREELGLSCPFVLEHVPGYFTFARDTMTAGECFARVVERTGAGVLLDLHNLYCDELNRGIPAERFIDRLPPSSIVELHLAGGRWLPGRATYLDGHDRDLPPRVLELLDYVLARATPKLIVIERENELHGLDGVLADLERIDGALKKAGMR
ncbi:DUF692 domain-containing protein [Myxococcota bacterium]|nr:DUF692 domain-containing protein [Myxococcota bacterium]